MEVKLISKTQKDEFNQFAVAHPLGSIHQAWEWGNWQKKTEGRKDSRSLAIIDINGVIRGTSVLIKQNLPLGFCWLYCPRGPLLSFGTKIFDLWMENIKKIAKKEKAVFLRIDPEIEYPEKGEPKFFPGFRKAHAEYQPEYTLKLDLNLSEEELLTQMKPKGRYNIKLAGKKGIKIISSEDKDHNPDKLVSDFFDLLKQTTERDGFSGHKKDYYKNMLEILGPNMAKIYLAEFKGKIIAGIIVTFFKDTAIYYFGASANEYRNLMAPYLLQWTAIKDSKKKGLKWYDFLGIAPLSKEGSFKDKNHPWRGVTDFKMKFGGKIYHFLPAQEYVFQKVIYWGMRGAKRIAEKL